MLYKDINHKHKTLIAHIWQPKKRFKHITCIKFLLYPNNNISNFNFFHDRVIVETLFSVNKSEIQGFYFEVKLNPPFFGNYTMTGCNFRKREGKFLRKLNGSVGIYKIKF